MMDSDGSDARQLTEGPDAFHDAFPDFSPDGTKIVFVSGPSGKCDLFVINSDGSGRQRITYQENIHWYPSWSPNGSMIAYSAGDTEWRDDIWLTKAPFLMIPATIDIDSDTLNLRSRGRWITAYIEFPEGYDVNDINVTTVMLNDTVSAELHSTEVEDYDGDGVPDLMVKFDRTEVTSYILANVNMTKLAEERFMTVTLTITGQLDDGTPFQGSDTITIMLPTHGKRGIFPI